MDYNVAMQNAWQSIAELPTWSRQAEKLLSDAERMELIAWLAAHPQAGDIMQGTGGVRKLRWARGGQGKSAGVRVIYYYHDADMPLYLLTLFAKGDKANLSHAERNELARLVKILVDTWKQRTRGRIS